MTEIMVDEFGMNFHPKNFKPQMDDIYTHLIASFSQTNGMEFHTIKE
jgi:hypothetical protein